MRIPLDQHIAEGIARGTPLIDIRPAYVRRFQDLYTGILERVGVPRNEGATV
jgi:hypothetical protein